ncbi:MAG: ribosome maturation factor RimP [bacterium]
MQKDKINKTEVIKKVTPVIEKAAEESDLILLEVDFVEEFGKWHLQVFIYNPKGATTHHDCEKITALLAEHLDLLIPIPYYLEVSSPGTERKLKSSKEYEIFQDNRVKIKLKQPINENIKVFVGTIVDYNEKNGLKIKTEETNQIIEIEENNISQIKLEPKYEY